MVDTNPTVPGHKLLPHESRWIRRSIAKTAGNSGGASSLTPALLLGKAGAANFFMVRNIALPVMVFAFTMAAITNAHGGPIQASGTPTPAWEVPLIVAWWLMIAAIPTFAGLGVMRLIQASRTGRRTPSTP
jgi:hypothetical protein